MQGHISDIQIPGKTHNPKVKKNTMFWSKYVIAVRQISFRKIKPGKAVCVARRRDLITLEVHT